MPEFLKQQAPEAHLRLSKHGQQALLDTHDFRKHRVNAYYGQR